MKETQNALAFSIIFNMRHYSIIILEDKWMLSLLTHIHRSQLRCVL